MSKNFSIFLSVLIMFISVSTSLIIINTYSAKKENNTNNDIINSDIEEKNTIIHKFNLSDYQGIIDENPINVGNIENAEMAIEKAGEAFIKKYNSIRKDIIKFINGSTPYVAYDKNNDCWYIAFYFPFEDDVLGTLPEAVIKSDGTVLDTRFS